MKNPAAKLLEFDKLVLKCIQTTFGLPSDPSLEGVAEDNQNATSVSVQHSNELPKDGTATYTMRQPGYTAVHADNEEDVEDGSTPQDIEYMFNTSEEGDSSTVAADCEVAMTTGTLPEDENGANPNYVMHQGNVDLWSLLDLPNYVNSTSIGETNTTATLVQNQCSPALTLNSSMPATPCSNQSSQVSRKYIYQSL